MSKDENKALSDIYPIYERKHKNSCDEFAMCFCFMRMSLELKELNTASPWRTANTSTRSSNMKPRLTAASTVKPASKRVGTVWKINLKTFSKNARDGKNSPMHAHTEYLKYIFNTNLR